MHFANLLIESFGTGSLGFRLSWPEMSLLRGGGLFVPKWLGSFPGHYCRLEYGIASVDFGAAEVSAACCGVNLAVLGWSGVLLGQNPK
jgi:hypothetical protein